MTLLSKINTFAALFLLCGQAARVTVSHEFAAKQRNGLITPTLVSACLAPPVACDKPARAAGARLSSSRGSSSPVTTRESYAGVGGDGDPGMLSRHASVLRDDPARGTEAGSTPARQQTILGSMGRVRSGYASETVRTEVGSSGIRGFASSVAILIRNRLGTVGSTPTDSTIYALITSAARRHRIPAKLALRRAFEESRMQANPPYNGRFYGVMQLSARFFPGAERMSVVDNVEAGTAYLARMYRACGRDEACAERAYRSGRVR